MKKLLQYTLLAIMTFGFVGCGGKYIVTFDSMENGTRFVCDGISIGLTSRYEYKKPAKEFNKNAIDSDGFLDIGYCEAIFSNGYVGQIDKFVQTKDYPDGVRITVRIPQSYYEAKRAKEKEAEIARKERMENDKKEHISKCLGGNMESCDIVIKEYSYTLNCNDYMKIIRKGCNLGSGYCCALLGNEFHSISVYQGGRWQPKYGANCSLRNQDEAFKYYKKACDLGESAGCQRYTELQNDIDEIDRRERDKTYKGDITVRQR